jgi:hypothetical protein
MAIRNLRRRAIQVQGWHIQYIVGEDQQGEFLDFFAAHRKANNRYVCIYSSADVPSLPTFREFEIFLAEASKAKKQRIQE